MQAHDLADDLQRELETRLGLGRVYRLRRRIFLHLQAPFIDINRDVVFLQIGIVQTEAAHILLARQLQRRLQVFLQAIGKVHALFRQVVEAALEGQRQFRLCRQNATVTGKDRQRAVVQAQRVLVFQPQRIGMGDIGG